MHHNYWKQTPNRAIMYKAIDAQDKYWTAFILFISMLNIVVTYYIGESIWVNFMLFAILGLSDIF